MNRSTKIVATLGPASSTPESIQALVDAGVNVFRFNMSHGSHAEHQARYLTVRQIEAASKRSIGVLMDLQGPKIRIGVVPGGPRLLMVGHEIVFSSSLVGLEPNAIPFPHPEILAELELGHILLVDDGKLKLEVTRTAPGTVTLLVQVGGMLSDRKGVNLPSTALPMSVLTPKDREDLAFGLALGLDWVALSFVQSAADIEELRTLVGNRVGILAKIEKPQAIEHLEAIVKASDALMVARGDLGVELPAEEVPGLQRRIIAVCRRLGRPVVVATQMLESMIQAPTPTRAEVSDVATAVYQGADAVMLSAETAAGSYPVQSVQIMARVLVQAEKDMNAARLSPQPPLSTLPLPTSDELPNARADVIGIALRAMCAAQRLAAAVTYTSSGASALCVARERPATALLALTPSAATARRLCLVWGVQPLLAEDVDSVEGMVSLAVERVASLGLSHAREPIAIVAGLPFATPGSTNLLHLVWPA